MPIITVSLTRFTREPSPCQKLREIKYVRIEKLASEPALAVDQEIFHIGNEKNVYADI